MAHESNSARTSRDPSPSAAQDDIAGPLNRELSMYDELQTRMSELISELTEIRRENTEIRRENAELKQRLDESPRVAASNDSQPSASQQLTLPSGSQQGGTEAAHVSYVMSRESVPLFKAEAPASQPLKKNHELESWIRQIENLTRTQTPAAYIRTARAHCRGIAEAIINSPMFDDITDWSEFKAKLRIKFRGTYSAGDFYRLLYEHRMVAGQAPQDYYIVLEATVHQGLRDYPEAVGDPEALVRRVFLQGLPQWLCELVAVKETAPMQELVELAQRVWNARMGFKGEDGPTKVPLGPKTSWYPRPNQVAYNQEDLTARQHKKFCTFHQLPGHDVSECRAAAAGGGQMQCYNCRGFGHIARNCPFPSRQGQRGPSTSGETTKDGTSKDLTR